MKNVKKSYIVPVTMTEHFCPVTIICQSVTPVPSLGIGGTMGDFVGD